MKRVLNEWILDAPSNIQTRLKEIVVKLDETIKQEMDFRKEGEKWIYLYNCFEMVCVKY